MATNPFKAFTPFTCDMDKVDARGFKYYDSYESIDPTGGQWSTLGFTGGIDGNQDFAHDLDGAATLITVRLNERILPGKVRDEKVKVRVAKLEAETGRKVTKKEYAELRGEVEFDLLPKAFIRRTDIPVVFMGTKNKWLLIGSPSARKVDQIIAFLTEVFASRETELNAIRFMPMRPVSTCLTELALEGADTYPTDEVIEAGSSLVLKGECKETIRIKDIDVTQANVNELVGAEGYGVTELAIDYKRDINDESPLASFVLTENFVFKRLTLSDIEATKHKGDAHGFAYIAWRTYLFVLQAMVQYMDADETENDEEEL